MALLKADDSVNSSKWSERDKKAPRHRIAEIDQTNHVNYDNLQKLCSIHGLGDGQNKPSSQKAHETFMKTYSSIFLSHQEATPGPSTETTLRLYKGLPSSSSDSKTFKGLPSSTCSRSCTSVSSVSHDIHDHLSHLHHQKIKVDKDLVKTNKIASLRKLLRKLPFERTREENDIISNLVKTFPSLTSQVEPHLLKELCSVAMIDVWDEDGITVYGNRGFYVILTGRVKGSTPYVKLLGTDVEVRSPTPEPDEEAPILGVGDCFGTFEPVDGRSENSRVLSVVTLDAHCEFLLITASDFARITQVIHSKEENRRISLLQSCNPYRHWSRQSLLVIANMIKWMKFIPNSVIAHEGSKAPFMAFIKSGECKVMRKVDALVTLPNMKQEKRTKDVFIGKLNQFESFGEINILSDIPMSCSIVTLTPVELAVVYPQDIKGFDSVTKQLIKQSCGRVFSHVSENDVQDVYMNQELEHQWKAFRKAVLQETISTSGIQPGHGKWTMKMDNGKWTMKMDNGKWTA